MKNFQMLGFEVVRGVFSESEVAALRLEADRVARAESTACVRHLREKSKEFDQLALSERLQELLPRGLSPVRSILFDKTPSENWPVTWHQDLTIAVKEKIELAGYGPWSAKSGTIHVQPPEPLLKEMVTIRIHLDETLASNGALRVIPGSHKIGKLDSKSILSHTNDSEVTCACAPGDVLLMSPLILHASKRAEGPKRRRIVHFEYAPLDALDARLSWYEPPTAIKAELSNPFAALSP